MNLKYYLRGLGIGILVTAIVMGIAMGGEKEQLSDEEIRTKAKALGMMEETVLSKMNQKEETDSSNEEIPEVSASVSEIVSEEEGVEVPTPSDTMDLVPTAVPTQAPEAVPTQVPTSVPTPETTKQPVTSGMGVPAEDVKNITITVSSGESSHTVCSKLEAAGLIASAWEFDSYLFKGGYDNKIRVGTYQIAPGASEETIAKIITGTK